jgi:hypothetical protein
MIVSSINRVFEVIIEFCIDYASRNFAFSRLAVLILACASMYISARICLACGLNAILANSCSLVRVEVR